jgi:uncharacterized protein YeaO (DUF488 family)
MALQIKRAYAEASKKDGFRVLVDRLWPRGVKKSSMPIDLWAKEIAPSNDLRKAFGHREQNWKTFQRDYRKELKNPDAKTKLKELAGISNRKTVTLIYAAKDENMNHALILKDVIEKI